jgi:DNA-binding transcriptional MerR regulator
LDKKRFDEKALSGDALFKMRDRLRIVLIATVLRETGFQLEQIEKVIKKNGIYLFNHIYKPQSLTTTQQ